MMQKQRGIQIINRIRPIIAVLFMLLLVTGINLLSAGSLDTACLPDAYSKSLADLSSVTAVVSLTLPLIPPAAQMLREEEVSQQSFGIGAGYAGTLSLTYGAVELLKRVVHRSRPFPDLADDPDESFPSRHTAMVTAAAAFASVLYDSGSSSAQLDALALAGSWGAALGTGILRIASGEHYVTDVLAGAAIGAVFGLLGGLVTESFL